MNKKSVVKGYEDRIEKLARGIIVRIERPWDDLSCSVLQNNHYVRRGKSKLTKWCPLNLFCGTRDANFRHEHDSSFMREWFLMRYGAEVDIALTRFANSPYKLTLADYERLEGFWVMGLLFKTRREMEKAWFLFDILPGQEELKNAWEKLNGKEDLK